jgi:predicted AAA+ superfamily ATPase
LDRPEEIEGTALETLVFQELLAVNDLLNLGFELFYWRTATGQEVDFVLYGESGLIAIEVKRAASIRSRELSGLKTFAKDYPESTRYMFYGGKKRKFVDGINLIPTDDALRDLPTLLKQR